MKFILFTFISWILSSGYIYAQAIEKTDSHSATLKPRLVVLTDISTWEPDDHESLIRLLAHADMIEIEGIVVSTGWSMDDVSKHKQFMDIATGVIDAYEKDVANLLKRSDQIGFKPDQTQQEIGYWPSPQYLKDRTMFGSKKRGMEFIGEDNHSAGSELIIKLADEEDDRPLWVSFWGGGNTLAQAIWQVQQTRSEADLKKFLNKVRAYAITDQDRGQKTSFEISSHAWMRREFSDDLLFIWDECAWKFQNGTGKANWSEYEKHIQNHGNLGAQYPKYVWGVEGDTPSFLHILPNGLNNPDEPTQAGWGGYAEWGEGPDKHGHSYVNHSSGVYKICREYENYFYPATFNNFAARMDWAKEGMGNRNPMVVLNDDSGIEILQQKVSPGTMVHLNASDSYDPDGDALTYSWWIMSEAGTYTQDIPIKNSHSSTVTLNIPTDAEGTSFHLICEVTDNGTHKLSSYRRVIFEVSSSQ